MKVRMNEGFRLMGPEAQAGPGEVVELPEEIAEKLVAQGVAVVIEEPVSTETAALATAETASKRSGKAPGRKRSQRIGKGTNSHGVEQNEKEDQSDDQEG